MLSKKDQDAMDTGRAELAAGETYSLKSVMDAEPEEATVDQVAQELFRTIFPGVSWTRATIKDEFYAGASAALALSDARAAAVSLEAGKQWNALSAERDALKAQVDQLTVQLAGCSTAAETTQDPATREMWGWSPSYQQVLELHLKYNALKEQLERVNNEVGDSVIEVDEYGKDGAKG